MSDLSPFKTYTLPNGLQPELHDRSRHYYGGYWQVVLELRCLVTISPNIPDLPQNHTDLCRQLGEQIAYIQLLERMAVPQDQLDAVRKELIAGFEAHTLPFIAHPGFATRFIVKELRRYLKASKRSFSVRHE